MPTEPRHMDKSDRSLPELLGDLSRDTVDLVRQEVALARAEVSEKMTEAQTGLKSMAMGGAVALAGLVVLLIAVSNLVSQFLPPELAPWLAPMIVGLVVIAIGYGMVKGGSHKLDSQHLKPHRTVASLRQDRATVQEKMR